MSGSLNLEAWDAVNWDVKFESLEWLLHLAACFNGQEPVWSTWPDWPADQVGDVPENERKGWLGTLQYMHEHPHISVFSDVISVTSMEGALWTTEWTGMEHGWTTVDLRDGLGPSGDVPAELRAALDRRYGRSESHAYVPHDWQHLCLDSPAGVPLWMGLRTMLALMHDGLAMYGLATDYHGTKCIHCGDTAYRQGRRGEGCGGLAPVPVECWTCTYEPYSN